MSRPGWDVHSEDCVGERDVAAVDLRAVAFAFAASFLAILSVAASLLFTGPNWAWAVVTPWGDAASGLAAVTETGAAVVDIRLNGRLIVVADAPEGFAAALRRRTGALVLPFTPVAGCVANEGDAPQENNRKR
jgi:hypothetical protein